MASTGSFQRRELVARGSRRHPDTLHLEMKVKSDELTLRGQRFEPLPGGPQATRRALASLGEPRALVLVEGLKSGFKMPGGAWRLSPWRTRLRRVLPR